MTRYYFNENPQVTYWKEKAKLYEYLKKFLDMAYNHEVDYNKKLVEKLREKNKAMKDFNAFPWWKKLFFRFEV